MREPLPDPRLGRNSLPVRRLARIIKDEAARGAADGRLEGRLLQQPAVPARL